MEALCIINGCVSGCVIHTLCLMLDFQGRFDGLAGYVLIEISKTDKFIWWDLEIISADAGSKFTLKEFKEQFQISRVNWTL